MTQNNFERKIPVSEDDNKQLELWISSLPVHEQKEWQRVRTLHQQIVNLAFKNNDAMLVRNHNNEPVEILWRNQDVHIEYIKQMKDHEIYQSFWERWRDSKK